MTAPATVVVRIDLTIDEGDNGDALAIVTRALDRGVVQDAIHDAQDDDEDIEITQALEYVYEAGSPPSAAVVALASPYQLSPAAVAVLQEISTSLGAADRLLAADTNPPDRHGDEYRRLMNAVREACLTRIAESVQ